MDSKVPLDSTQNRDCIMRIHIKMCKCNYTNFPLPQAETFILRNPSHTLVSLLENYQSVRISDALNLTSWAWLEILQWREWKGKGSYHFLFAFSKFVILESHYGAVISALIAWLNQAPSGCPDDTDKNRGSVTQYYCLKWEIDPPRREAFVKLNVSLSFFVAVVPRTKSEIAGWEGAHGRIRKRVHCKFHLDDMLCKKADRWSHLTKKGTNPYFSCSFARITFYAQFCLTSPPALLNLKTEAVVLLEFSLQGCMALHHHTIPPYPMDVASNDNAWCACATTLMMMSWMLLCHHRFLPGGTICSSLEPRVAGSAFLPPSAA